LNPGAEDSTQLATRLTKVADALAASPLVAKAEVLTDPSRLSPEGWAAVFIGLPRKNSRQFANATSEAEIHARLHTARDALGGWPDQPFGPRIHYDPLGLSDYVVTTSPSAVTGPPPSAPNPILRVAPKIRANTLATAEPLVSAVRAALAANGFAPGSIA